MHAKRIIPAVADVHESAKTLRDALDAIIESAGKILEMDRNGMSERAIIDFMVDRIPTRAATGYAIDQYETNMRLVRSLVLASLVESRGLTMTQAARVSGITRQQADRLYGESIMR